MLWSQNCSGPSLALSWKRKHFTGLLAKLQKGPILHFLLAFGIENSFRPGVRRGGWNRHFAGGIRLGFNRRDYQSLTVKFLQLAHLYFLREQRRTQADESRGIKRLPTGVVMDAGAPLLIESGDEAEANDVRPRAGNIPANPDEEGPDNPRLLPAGHRVAPSGLGEAENVG